MLGELVFRVGCMRGDKMGQTTMTGWQAEKLLPFWLGITLIVHYLDFCEGLVSFHVLDLQVLTNCSKLILVSTYAPQRILPTRFIVSGIDFSPFLTISLCRAGHYFSHPLFSILCHVFSQFVFLHVSLYVVPPSLFRSTSVPPPRNL